MPTSTFALVLLATETVRILVVGDSGVRVNGTDVYRHFEGIDENVTEIMARRAIFQGLDTCVAEQVISEKPQPIFRLQTSKDQQQQNFQMIAQLLW